MRADKSVVYDVGVGDGQSFVCNLDRIEHNPIAE